MLSTKWTCCTSTQEPPWWIWLLLLALVVGLIIRIVWGWRQGGFRAAADSPAATRPSTPTYAVAKRLRKIRVKLDRKTARAGRP